MSIKNTSRVKYYMHVQDDLTLKRSTYEKFCIKVNLIFGVQFANGLKTMFFTKTIQNMIFRIPSFSEFKTG